MKKENVEKAASLLLDLDFAESHLRILKKHDGNEPAEIILSTHYPARKFGIMVGEILPALVARYEKEIASIREALLDIGVDMGDK